METHVQRLLPCHPLVCDSPNSKQAPFLCGVRLVVLTRMHVLLLESIVVFHPQLFSPACPQQLSWMQTHIRAYEEGLYLAIPPTECLYREGIARSIGLPPRAENRLHGLLVVFLLRELDAAVSELMTWSKGPYIPAP
ncbi:hypothetical protein Q4I30_005035 [Leishmania utingensis]|uniref:Uncharacterized protein n=1 Tax=Leishmania utingensis TaxID=653362 RepID=A0AAW3ACB2_9TRYP